MASMIRHPEQFQTLLAEVRTFVRERWHPLENKVEQLDHVPEDIVNELRQRGFFGWSIPEAYGGLGLSTEELILAAFELSQALGNRHDAVPFTLMINAKEGITSRHFGVYTRKDLESDLAKALK